MDRKQALLPGLLLVSSIAITLSAWLFGIFPFDLVVAGWLQGFSHPLFMTVMRAVSFPGDGWVPALLVTAGAAVCAAKRRWTEAFFIVATMSSILIAQILKFLISRPRPSGFSMNLYDLAQPFNQYAYPSGHTLFFVVFFGFVAYLSWTHLTGMARWLLITVCAVFIVLIGPSRVLLGAHWVSDVIGSYLIGAFLLVSLILIYQEIHHTETFEPKQP